MLRILIVLFGLFIVAALPGGAKALDNATTANRVDCHGLTMMQEAAESPVRHAGHGVPAQKSGLDCCLGTSLCRLACAAVEPFVPGPVPACLPASEPRRVADALPLEGHAVPPLLGPPRLILI